MSKIAGRQDRQGRPRESRFAKRVAYTVSRCSSRLLPILIAAQPFAAIAQVTTNAGSPGTGDILVTAQRRAERLIDVPASIAAVPHAALEASGVETLHQLGELVPGLVVSPPVGLTAAVYIRGVGADSRNIGFDSRVGVYVDGVYVGQSPALDQELSDIERVEVLRGPQGTLFGKNSIAGAVNIITRSPSSELEGRLQLRGGNRNSFQAIGSINLPLSDQVATRIAVSRNRRDGWVTNLFDGSRLGNVDQNAWRGQVKIEPAERLSATFTIEKMDSSSRAYVADNLTDSFGTVLDSAAPGRRQVMFSKTPDERRRLVGGSLVLRTELAGGYELVSITSYRRTRFRIALDEDWSAARLFEVSYTDRYRDHAQEFQLVSGPDKPVRYLIGAYYQHQNNFTDRQVPTGPDIVLLPFGIMPGAVVSNRGTIRTDSYAAYFHVTAKLTDAIEVSLGTRYSYDRKHVNWSIDGNDIPAFNLATGTLIDRKSEHDLSPSLTLSYRLAPWARIYGRYAQGFKSGGFNVDFVSADIFPNKLGFAKETVRSYETGLKAEMPGLPLMLDLAAFFSRYSNYQVNQFQDLGGGRTAIVISNAASVETSGLEAEAELKPSSSLKLSGGIALLNAHFRHFPGGGVAGSDVSGNRLPYASKIQASMAVDYSGASGLLGAAYPFAHLDLSYRSGFFTTVDNVRTQPLLGGGAVHHGYARGYFTANARLGVGYPRRHLQLSVWTRNLFDRRYTTWMYRDFLGTILELTGEPRSYGLEAHWRL
jgi:iron complex outermembrane receptor protein